MTVIKFQMNLNGRRLSFTIPTSSAVVSEVQMTTSSEEGRDDVLSCMYRESTVPKMSSKTRYVIQIETGIQILSSLHKVRLA